MAGENKHDIAIQYCSKVILEHNRNWRIQRDMLEKLSKSGISLPKVLKLLRETALEQMSAKTFEHLKRKAL